MTVAVAEVSADNGSVCIRLSGEIDREMSLLWTSRSARRFLVSAQRYR